jgi:adenylate kinase
MKSLASSALVLMVECTRQDQETSKVELIKKKKERIVIDLYFLLVTIETILENLPSRNLNRIEKEILIITLEYLSQHVEKLL